MADAASFYLHHSPSGFRNDCSGFVCAAFDRAGIEMGGSTRTLWDSAKQAGAIHHRKRPSPGDIAFFDNTYDRNRNRRFDDPLSHVAVVLEVQPNGTILLAHAGTGKGRTTLTMNLTEPGTHVEEDGTLLNDWLRRRRDDDPAGGKYLAGELWRGFATPDAFD
ncbi:MAG: surface antigen [Myxococcota bacterium]